MVTALLEMLLVMDPLTPTHWTDRSVQYLAATGSVYDAVKNGTSDTNYRFYGDDRGMYATSYFLIRNLQVALHLHSAIRMRTIKIAVSMYIVHSSQT